MTEQIKSAIETLETYDMSEDNDDTEFKDSIALAINSLKAWEEVLNELLEHLEDSIPSPTMFLALLDAIDIINKHLAESGEK